MKPLLKITSVPIQLECRVQNDKANKYVPARLSVTREKGDYLIQSKDIQLKIQSRPAALASKAAQNQQLASTAVTTTTLPQSPVVLENQSIKNELLRDGQFDSAASELSIRIEIDHLRFEWKSQQKDLEFIPGSIEFHVTDYPKVIIEYLGSPIYVPASANPDYEPAVQVKV